MSYAYLFKYIIIGDTGESSSQERGPGGKNKYCTGTAAFHVLYCDSTRACEDVYIKFVELLTTSVHLSEYNSRSTWIPQIAENGSSKLFTNTTTKGIRTS